MYINVGYKKVWDGGWLNTGPHRRARGKGDPPDTQIPCQLSAPVREPADTEK